MNAVNTAAEPIPVVEKGPFDLFEMRKQSIQQNSRKRPEDFGKRFFEGVHQAEESKNPQKEPCKNDLHSLPPPEKKEERTGAKTAGFGLQQNSDTVFILSIIMLLMSEKADFMLIFALMYILM